MTQTEALLAIAKRNGNTINARLVLDEARDEESPLHNAFTWDDSIAADKWRVHEAQELIRKCRITAVNDKGKTVETYAFIGLSTDREGAASDNPYRLAHDVAKCDDLLAVAEHDALEQLKSVQCRYKHLTRLKAVWDVIDALTA